MPIHYWILEDEDLTYAHWSGRITPEEIRRNFAAYLDNPRYRQGRPELIDLLDVISIDVGIRTMGPLLSMVNAPELRSDVKTRTVVVTRRKVIFGIARMYQLLASSEDGVRIQVFDDEAEALAALGRPENRIADLIQRPAAAPTA